MSGQHGLRLTHQKPLLYSNQNSLPHLPVPPLEQTCRKFLLSVKPLLDENEFKEMEKLVEGFKNKEGKRFQLYLNLKSWMSENYVHPPLSFVAFVSSLQLLSCHHLQVAEWWEKYVYLRGRSPILINSNYYILDCGLPKPPTKIQVARAANLISIALDFKYQLDRELVSFPRFLGLFSLVTPFLLHQFF